MKTPASTFAAPMNAQIQIRDYAAALAEIVLAQRTETSAKYRKKVAADYRKRWPANRRPAQCFEVRVPVLKEFVQLSPHSRQKAWEVVLVLSGYHFCVDRLKLIPNEANIVARGLLLLIWNKSVCESTIRNWLRRERAGGGPDVASIKFYADIPHGPKSALKEVA